MTSILIYILTPAYILWHTHLNYHIHSRTTELQSQNILLELHLFPTQIDRDKILQDQRDYQ
ncbi:hypothetical protein JD969_08630 [Planctomycetota bacterium]|nr:hypothetical protein JD969_08630 [Planctomycetota bacterium]